jgi:hypothetical protein
LGTLVKVDELDLKETRQNNVAAADVARILVSASAETPNS